MQVVVLAGGLATRMQSRFRETPKILIPVCGQPFLALQLENLARRGATSVVLCIGHLGERVQEYVEATPLALPITFSHEGEQRLGTAGALRTALRDGLLQERFIVGFGDSYLPTDLTQLLADHRSPSSATMTVFANDDWRLPSNCAVADGRVTLYAKRALGSPRDPAVKYIDYGLTVLERSFVESFGDESPLDLSVVLGEAVRRGEVGAHEVFERFHEIGSLEGLAALEAGLERGDPFRQAEGDD